MIVMVVGDVYKELALFAKTIDINSTLLTEKNSTNVSNGTYYLSLGEFDSYRSFVDILELADTIIYHPPPDKWSDTDRNGFSYMKQWTEIGIKYFYDKKTVKNIEIQPIDTGAILDIVDTRKTDHSQIWIAGGSDSHGLGVEPFENYGQIIANYFDREVSFLTAPGASISWIADQILRSDIRSGDLIVMGTVPDVRLPFYHDKKVLHLTVSEYEEKIMFNKTFPLHLLNSDDTCLYRPIVSINQVINVCKKLGAHLIIAGLSPTLFSHLIQFSNYINLYHRFGLDPIDRFLDIGTDNQHPGPETHKYYASHIIDRIKQLNFNF